MALKPKTPLRRSFSEHVKDSTNKAWEIFWRSAREKRLSEIEAKEACEWLQAAGFPQYAQLYQNCHIPIDIDWVKSDHEFLDSDTLDSLCRRLTTLNKCVEMKLDLIKHKRRGEVDDDMEPCAISPKWFYDQKSRCWVRTGGMDFLPSLDCPISSFRRSESCDASLSDSSEHHEILSMHSSSSADSDADCTDLKTSEEPETCLSPSRCPLPSKTLSPDSPYSGRPSPVEPRNFSSKEGFSEKPPLKKCQSLIRKMDKLRFRRSTLQLHGPSRNRQLVIGNPVLQEGYPEDKHNEFHILNLTSSAKAFAPPYGSSSSPSENSSAVSTPSPITKVRSNYKRQNSSSQAQEQIFVSEQKHLNQHSLNGNTVFEIPHGHKPGTFPTMLHHTVSDDTSVNWRTGSFHGYHRRRCQSSTSKDQGPQYSPLVAHDHRVSIYDNVPDHLDDDVFSALDSVMDRITGLQQLVTSWTDKLPEDGDSDFSHSSTSPSSLTDIHLEIKDQSKKDQNESKQNCRKILQEWPNTPQLSNAQNLYWSSEQISSSLSSSTQAIESQLAPCVSMLQRLSLLRLTVLMDKHSPFSKQGWNWAVPKVYTKITVPEHKHRKVFGVTLLQSVQRSGKPLPPSILRAMEYLKTDCLDQVGLFRKSGVKSRIQYLREMIEVDPEGFSFEEQSAFDVADMIKQYFRDLPEPIFSRKLCESFLHIYQYFPKDQQFEAVQAAIFLLPDENREALQCLLFFLHEVVAFVEENQMTPTNIAVCLAPSLFHLNILKRDSSRGGQRKYSLGRPDQRDLSENLAATQGLAHMITECTRLFQLPPYWKPSIFNEETLNMGCSVNTAENELVDRSKLDAMVQQLLREMREKPKSWVAYPTCDHVDVAFKKMEDGSPLRLWRGAVDVDVPQKEVFQRVLREHSQWQNELQHSKVTTLDKDLEMYQYALQAAGTRPPLQHLLLRTWQSDPSSGPLFVAATSAHLADVANGGVTTRVLCCMFLVEATATKKSRLTHFCRIDTGGRSLEWHNKIGGHLLSQRLVAIKNSFKPKTKGTL